MNTHFDLDKEYNRLTAEAEKKHAAEQEAYNRHVEEMEQRRAG